MYFALPFPIDVITIKRVKTALDNTVRALSWHSEKMSLELLDSALCCILQVFFFLHLHGPCQNL